MILCHEKSMDASNHDTMAVPSLPPVVPKWMTQAIWAFLVLGVGLRPAVNAELPAVER